MFLLKGREGQEAETCLGQLQAPPGFSGDHIFQKHVVSYLCAVHRDYSMYNKARHMPNTMQSEVRRRRVDDVDFNRMLAQAFDTMVVGVMKSKFKFMDPIIYKGFCQGEDWKERCSSVLL